MATLPQKVREAWDSHEGPVVFATVSEDGIPNIIYATCVSAFGEDKLVVADNYFDKTRKNLLANPQGSILFITKDYKAYQVKGPISYHTEGEIFEHMKTWNPEKHPGHAAAALTVEEVYKGAEKLC